MSSHFNYEIDERNLRVRLKDMKIPHKEEAWLQFEMYSESCKSNFKTSSLPRFQLNINRNVVLPVVFGIVIIAFSLLLFNFVSIKNKPLNTLAAKLPVEEVKKEEPKKIVPPVVKNVVVETPKIDSTQIKLAAMAPPTVQAVSQPSVTETKTVAVVTKTVQPIAEANKNIPAKEEPKKVTESAPSPAISQAKAWTTTETADIYSRPDNKSEILGSARSNRAYEAIEETNYYIKVSFQSNGSTQTGYIKKFQVRKNSDSALGGGGVKKKNRKPEILESAHVPTSLPTEDKEPELK